MAEKTVDGTTLGQKYLSVAVEDYSSREVYTPSVVNVSRASGISTPLQDGRSELIQKHNKHVNDLKTYYGRELERLNERIRSLEHSRPTITDALQQSKQDERYTLWCVFVTACYIHIPFTPGSQLDHHSTLNHHVDGTLYDVKLFICGYKVTQHCGSHT